jgi:hypothetical protein
MSPLETEWSWCWLQGMCYTHSLACGGGTCCFLLFKVTRLLVIRQNRWDVATCLIELSGQPAAAAVVDRCVVRAAAGLLSSPHLMWTVMARRTCAFSGASELVL